MTRPHRALAIAFVFASLAFAGGCQQPADTAPAPTGTSGAASSDPTSPAVTPSATVSPVDTPSPAGSNPSKADPYSGTNDGFPELTPTSTAPDAAKTETGARAILLPWARGIELREFDQSWDMMGAAAQTQVTKTAFNAMFAPLRDLVVAVPGGSMEGAAGSIYYTVPTTITGTARDGSKRTFSGEVVLRRVNDVPGATPAQLNWHIDQVNLKPA